MDFYSLPRLTSQEVLFLKEYNQVISPLAQALNLLHGEHNMHMGFLLPTALQQKLNKLSSLLTLCRPSLQVILQGLQKRFEDTFGNKDLILSACFHPKFKINWLDRARGCVAKGNMLEAMNKTSTEEKIFFCFERQSNRSSAKQELEQFLANMITDIQMLNGFPTVKTIKFIKYNTGLPTRASVERVFSVVGIVLRTLRSKLGDETFEKQLLLKMNKQFI